jgi:hypothetical protein
MNNDPYSIPDSRDFGNFPNDSEEVQGTDFYVVPKKDSRTAGPPVDSRKKKPVDSRVEAPQNSRTEPPFDS